MIWFSLLYTAAFVFILMIWAGATHEVAKPSTTNIGVVMIGLVTLLAMYVLGG